MKKDRKNSYPFSFYSNGDSNPRVRPLTVASPFRQPTVATFPASTGKFTPKVHQTKRDKHFAYLFLFLT